MSPAEAFFTIDIELTNRCNAKCYFCPRDQTPHQGLMSGEVFDQVLARAIEFRQATLDLDGDAVRVSLCGLGEPLLNPLAADAVRKVKAADFECVMASNGSVLDERKGRALLAAGLDAIYINVGDHDDAYESIYKLPFHQTLENVLRFSEMADGACTVSIVLVDHRRNRAHIDDMMQYWRGLGLKHFLVFDLINRGGALFVDDMQFESMPQLADAQLLLQGQGRGAVCGAPFRYIFVGYDGHYYLCGSDWKKQVPLGTVFQYPVNALVGAKLEHVKAREPICKTCNCDPLNVIAHELAAVDEGESDLETVEKLVDDMVANTHLLYECVVRIEQVTTPSRRRLIPVRSA